MGRKPATDTSQLKAAALRVVAEAGAQGTTVAGIAAEAGVPTGSVYHRFASRDELLAELWLDLVEEFQAGLLDHLAEEDPEEAAEQAALFTLVWCRSQPAAARLLLLHRREELVPEDWPAASADRAAALENELDRALRKFARRLYGSTSAAALRRVSLALQDIPLAAVRRYLLAETPVPTDLDAPVAHAVAAVLSD